MCAHYSSRSAAIGSTRAPRREVDGHGGVAQGHAPNDRSHQPRQGEGRNGADSMPAAAVRMPRPSSMPSELAREAPSAIRTPISCRNCAATYDMTP